MHASAPPRDPTLEFRRELRLDALVGRSPALAAMLRRMRPVLAIERLQVLLTGPSGSGKSLVARVIHENGPRAAGPFVEVNCAAIPRELWEAEFFGTSRHAYTGAAERQGRFASAEGGTLFLDEVGELPAEQQAKLLRVLDSGRFERLGEEQTRCANARIIAATNRDLERAVETGAFRADLYFRLAGYRIAVPPLAERAEDVAELAIAFAEQEGRRMGLPPLRLSPAAAHELGRRAWPGNVRELRSAVAQAALEAFAEGAREIEPRHVVTEPAPARAVTALTAVAAVVPVAASAAPASAAAPAGTAAAAPGVSPLRPLAGGPRLSFAQATREFQRSLLSGALQQARGNVTHAARALGLSRSHIYKLMHELELGRDGRRPAPLSAA